MNVILWIVQILLSLFSLAAGWNHGLRPISDTIQSSPWAADLRSLERWTRQTTSGQ